MFMFIMWLYFDCEQKKKKKKTQEESELDQNVQLISLTTLRRAHFFQQSSNGKPESTFFLW